MILGRVTEMVEGTMIKDKEEDLGWQKRQQYVKRCNLAVCRRWQREYVTGFCERHNMQHKSKAVKAEGIVMIKSESKKRGKLKIGI